MTVQMDLFDVIFGAMSDAFRQGLNRVGMHCFG